MPKVDKDYTTLFMIRRDAWHGKSLRVQVERNVKLTMMTLNAV